MSKNPRRPRSASPTRYSRGPGQPAATQTTSPERADTAFVTKGGSRSSGMTRAQAAAVNFAEEYQYVYRDLRRIGILSGVILAILIILSFII